MKVNHCLLCFNEHQITEGSSQRHHLFFMVAKPSFHFAPWSLSCFKVLQILIREIRRHQIRRRITLFDDIPHQQRLCYTCFFMAGQLFLSVSLPAVPSSCYLLALSSRPHKKVCVSFLRHLVNITSASFSQKKKCEDLGERHFVNFHYHQGELLLASLL